MKKTRLGIWQIKILQDVAASFVDRDPLPGYVHPIVGLDHESLHNLGSHGLPYRSRAAYKLLEQELIHCFNITNRWGFRYKLTWRGKKALKLGFYEPLDSF